MNIEQFLGAVLPPVGPYRVESKRRYHKPEWVNTVEELAALAIRRDQEGANVWFRTASFNDKSKAGQKNVALKGCYHMDVDIGKGESMGYDTRKEGSQAIVKFIKDTGLPPPLIVDSGHGYHLYWPLEESVPYPLWEQTARRLSEVAKEHLFRHDNGKCIDGACLLRPPGTANRKNAPNILPVKVLRAASATTQETMMEVLGGDPLAGATPTLFGPATDLVVERENIPSDADEVAKECAFIRDFKDTGFGGGGKQGEWYYALGVVQYCVDGDQKAHEWSQQADNYKQEHTQKELERWRSETTGPAKCATIENNCPGYCEGCAHRGEITTPKELGHTKAQTVQLTEIITEREDGPWFPPKSGWSETKGSMWTKVWNAKANDGMGAEEKCYWCSTQFYVSNRIKADGKWMLQVHRRKYVNDDGTEVWEDFMVPTSNIARPTDMATEFAQQEVYMTDKDGAQHLTKILKGYGDALRDAQIETQMHTVMGWHCSDPNIKKGDMSYAAHADGFIIGNRLITQDGETEMLLSDDVRDDWHKGFGKKGTLKEWAKGIHKYFVETKAIPFQFILLTDLACPFVELAGSSEYHGGLVSLVSKSGNGKTTACKAGMTIWGNPKKLLLNGNPSAGITPKAFQKALSSLSNIGILFDEVGKQQAAVLGEMAYVVSMGKGRDRLGIGGKPLPTDEEWFSITKMTSNKPVMQIVADDENDNEDAQDALQKRVFEINFERLGYSKEDLAGDEQRGLELMKFIDSQYGTAGPYWARYILANKDDVIERLGINYAKVKKRSQDPSERFLDHLEAQVITAAEFASKAGIFHADVVAVTKFIKAVRDDMRSVRADSKVPVEDAFSRYLASNNSGIIMTKRFPTGMGRSASLEVPMNQGYAKEYIGRIATEDHVAYLAVLPMKDWCRRSGVDFTKMIHELDNHGWFQHDPKKLKTMKRDPMKTATDRVDITRGTSISGSRSTCFLIDFSRIGNKTVLRGVDDEEAASN